MKILPIFFLVAFIQGHAHKNRIERPQKYRFIFQTKDTVYIRSSRDSLLKVCSNDIINRKRQLIEAQLTFNTGEILTFSFDDTTCKTIRIARKKKALFVPESTTQKISEIHFQSVALLWSSHYHNAFTAANFYIAFDIGTEKLFDKYANLQLHFSENKFSKATVGKPVSENSTKSFTF